MAHRRPNKKVAHTWRGRTRSRSARATRRWPVNDYVLGAALLLVGAIILIAIAVATGLVKP